MSSSFAYLSFKQMYFLTFTLKHLKEARHEETKDASAPFDSQFDFFGQHTLLQNAYASRIKLSGMRGTL